MNNNTTKNMKYLIILVLGILAINVYSQKMAVIDTTRIKCSYEYMYLNDTTSENKVYEKDILHLQIGSTYSKCYSYYTYQSDSLAATPDGDKAWDKIFREASDKGLKGDDLYNVLPHRRMKSRLYKNHDKKSITITESFLSEYYIYEDSLDLQEWAYNNDITANILGHECQMATCRFRGRDWTAWFALDIPISDGPWKFSGLPGLIMEVYDKGHQHHFCINGLQETDSELIYFGSIGIDPKLFKKIERRKLLQTRYNYLKNSNSVIEATTGISLGDANCSVKYDLLERE